MSVLYPALKKMGEGIEYLTIELLVERILSETEKATEEFIDDLWKDLHLLFDECIDQYYKYTTRRYYRHDTGIGTGTGMNLYRSINEKNSNGVIEIWFDSSDMAGYKPYKDKEGNEHPIDAGYVLDNVMNGIRGLPYSASRYGGDSMSWAANVSTSLFGNLSGTIYAIISNINSNVVNVGSDYISSRVLTRMGYSKK